MMNTYLFDWWWKKIKRGAFYQRPSFFVVLLTLILMPGLLSNFWGAVGKKWFIEWRMTKDAPVIGRLVQSRQVGIFSYAGLMGWGDASQFENSWLLTVHQYDVYKSSEYFTVNEFKTYNSAIDFQGVIFSISEAIFDFGPKSNLLIFQYLTALLTAVVLSLIVWWIYSQIGFLASLFAAGFILFSEWITLFGGSIYWSLWSIYLPFVVMIYWLDRSQSRDLGGGYLFLIVYLTMLTKTLFNGFEYITTVLIMSFCPLIYYAFIGHWQLIALCKKGFCVATAEFFAVLTALVVLIIQNAFVFGDIGKAINYIDYSLEKRSIGNPGAFAGDPSLVRSLQAETLPVLKEYVLGRALRFNFEYLGMYIPGWRLKNIDISYLVVFIIFIIFSFLFFVFKKTDAYKESKLPWFVVTMWLSLVAPLSWFVIFKAHSYLHPHLNFIVWQMPFTLLGFGMCGAITQSFLHRPFFKIFN
jgi:hypothetical protein